MSIFPGTESPAGDRVQWFRAEAEMYRRLEQLEIEHADFERTLRHFQIMMTVWNHLAAMQDSPSSKAYAIKMWTSTSDFIHMLSRSTIVLVFLTWVGWM